MDTYGPYDLRLQSKTTTILSGPSRAGKSNLAIKIALERKSVFRDPPERVVYFYKQYQKIFKSAETKDKKITFLGSKEQVDDILHNNVISTLLIIDDYVTEASHKENTYITEYFLNRSHHENLTILFLSQLLYPKNGRAWSLNSTHLVLFKTFHEGQLNYYFRNLNPKKVKFLLDSYKFCTAGKPYGHFFMSLDPTTPDEIRYRSSIIPEEGTVIFMQQDGEDNKQF